MRWADEITLITLTDPTERVNANGFPNEQTEAKTTIFGNRKSVGFSEFYKAAQTGYQTELKFDVFKEEYAGQKLAEVDGVRYKVLRTYNDPKKPDETELTLSDLSEVPEGGGTNGAV